MTMIENASENMEKSVSSNEVSNNYEELYQVLIDFYCLVAEYSYTNIEKVRIWFKEVTRYETILSTSDR